MRKTIIISELCLLTALGACGGNGEGSNGEEITVAYVKNEITTEFSIPGSPATAGGTVLVHDDGYQGNSIDIGRVILSKINSSDLGGDTLAIAFSWKQNANPAVGTFAAFYVDTDNNASSGKPITGNDNVTIGADVLFLDMQSFDMNGSSSIFSADYHVWSGTGWVGENGFVSRASYYEGYSINKAVFASSSSGVPSLLGQTGAKGLFTVQVIPSGDPDSVTATVDKTDSFSFDFPS